MNRILQTLAAKRECPLENPGIRAAAFVTAGILSWVVLTAESSGLSLGALLALALGILAIGSPELARQWIEETDTSEDMQ